MNWNEIFDAEHIPSSEDIREYLGEATSIWDALTAYIEETYHVKPQIAYSKCSAQPGWNVKYKKSSKALCTLYPMAGYFIALVVVGPKEEEEVKIGMDVGLFTTYVKRTFARTLLLTSSMLLLPACRNILLASLVILLSSHVSDVYV